MSTEATINLFQEIPLILSVVDPVTGKAVPNALLSGVSFSMDSAIGKIIPDPNNPNLATFIPNKAGVTHIQAIATVTIP